MGPRAVYSDVVHRRVEGAERILVPERLAKLWELKRNGPWRADLRWRPRLDPAFLKVHKDGGAYGL